MRHAYAPHHCRPHHAHHGRHGGGAWGWGGWAPGPRRGRRGRGDVRAAILLLLEEEPRNGYGLMQQVEERSSGAWRPSPGSIYPALQQLEDEGLIRAEERDGKRVREIPIHIVEKRPPSPIEALVQFHHEFERVGRQDVVGPPDIRIFGGDTRQCDKFVHRRMGSTQIV